MYNSVVVSHIPSSDYLPDSPLNSVINSCFLQQKQFSVVRSKYADMSGRQDFSEEHNWFNQWRLMDVNTEKEILNTVNTIF